MRILGLIFFLVVVLIGLSFAVLNADPVTLNYYFGSSKMPLSLVAVVALVTGAVLGVIACLGLILRLKKQNARLRKNIRVAEKEISNLRNIPIKEQR